MNLFDPPRLTKLSKCYQRPAIVSWNGIKKLAIKAQCHVLLILDCCLPKGTGDPVEVQNLFPPVFEGEEALYTTEVITATVWDSETYDGMSKALCRVLDDKSLKSVAGMSSDALYSAMVKIQDKQREDLSKEISHLRQEQETEDLTSRINILRGELKKLKGLKHHIIQLPNNGKRAKCVVFKNK